MCELATFDEPVWPQLVLKLILCLMHVLLGVAKLPKELKELIQGDGAATISVQHSTALEQVLLHKTWVKPHKLGNEVSDPDLLSVSVGDVCKDVQDILSLVLSDPIEDLLQLLDALSDSSGNLIVWVPKLDLLEDREGNRVDEDDAAIDAGCVHNQDLLVALLE